MQVFLALFLRFIAMKLRCSGYNSIKTHYGIF